MKTNQNRLRESTRILWAITSKDLVEALKNKNTLFLIVFGILMVVFYAKYPTLMERNETPAVLVYDQGSSALMTYLENSRDVKAYKYSSEAEMKEKLGNGDVPELGLVIPADFDRRVESGGEPVLQGYFMHWVAERDAARLQSTVEPVISQLVGTQVQIQVQGNVVFPTPESGGLGVNAGFGFVYIITMLGLIMIPHLMLEEKQARTIEALLVSPASEAHVVLGKALTGLFYCLVGAGIGLAIFQSLVVHWWLAILAVLFGSLFTVSMGLLLGTAINDRGQLTLLAWVFIIPLFLPMFLSLMDDLLPAVAIQIFRAIPTVVMFNLLRTSFSGTFPLLPALLQLAWIAAWVSLSLLVVAWLLGRRDREAAAAPGLWRMASELVGEAAGGLRTFPPLLGGLQTRGKSQAEPEALSGDLLGEGFEIQDQVGKPSGSLRIIWAIAAKDIGMAIKNKLVISILLGTLLVVANGSILPVLLGLGNKPTAIVYDEGRSTIVRALTAREEFRLGIVDSMEEMQNAISGAPDTRIGLVIPADFDQRAGRGELIELEGYLAHWADTDKASHTVATFDEALGLASWGTVRINTQGHVLYPSVDSGGQLSITTLMMLIVILTIGMALVPLLFIEEKEAHTMDALLVSPASLSQLLAGKALAGAFYCLLAASVALVLNRYLMVHWGVAILAILLGSAFAVAIGLIVGFLSETPTTTGLWGGLLLIILFVLTGLQSIAGENWPGILKAFLDWQPGATLIRLFRISMAGEYPAGLLWSNIAAVLLAVMILYAVILGMLRRANA